MMGERPERKSDFRSGLLRSEVKLQSKLDVARVAGAPEASEVAGAQGQSCVAEVTQRIVCSVEDIKEVRLERQAHVFSRQSEVLPNRQVRYESIGAGEGAHAARARTDRGRVHESIGIEPLTRSGRRQRYARSPIRA